MDQDRLDKARAAAARELALAEEVETHALATLDGSPLEKSRAALHAWIDGVAGVVVNAALGRVTLIHENGDKSTIASPDLPFILSRL